MLALESVGRRSYLGSMESYLRDGSTLKLTQPALVLEKLIGRMLTNAAAGESPPAKTP